MALLRNVASGQTRALEQENLVGRASVCALKLDERCVSAQHALFRWTGDRWEVRDLGSRNGTFLNGHRVTPGELYRLDVSDRIAFAKPELAWEIADVSAPAAMVVPLDHGPPILIDGDLVAIPSPQEPTATIYRSADAGWLLEQAVSVHAITDQQTFLAGGRTWKFCCPDDLRKTSLLTFSSLELRHLQLCFSVSRDEEHVRLQGICGTQRLELGDRSHNYLLLTLARRRLADVAEGLPEAACGWLYQEDLGHDPSMMPPILNINVFRIRKQFAAAGIADAATIVERRPRTRQLRIGVSRLSVVTIG
jgi:hypothetical protein